MRGQNRERKGKCADRARLPVRNTAPSREALILSSRRKEVPLRMNPPLFSIIMPVYNAAETLCDAVGSITAQTCPDWELLLVDDGSTDASAALAERLAAADPASGCCANRTPASVPPATAGWMKPRAPTSAFVMTTICTNRPPWPPRPNCSAVKCRRKPAACRTLSARAIRWPARRTTAAWCRCPTRRGDLCAPARRGRRGLSCIFAEQRAAVCLERLVPAGLFARHPV